MPQATLRAFFKPREAPSPSPAQSSPPEELLGGLVPRWAAAAEADTPPAHPPAAPGACAGDDSLAWEEESTWDGHAGAVRGEDGGSAAGARARPSAVAVYTSKGKRARCEGSPLQGAGGAAGGSNVVIEGRTAAAKSSLPLRERGANGEAAKDGMSRRSVAGSCAGGKKRRTSTQTFLDLGQRDFGASTCAVCGCVYMRGVEEDERAHAAVHDAYASGARFPGWRSERTLVRFEPEGRHRGAPRPRVLMVLPTDPAAHRRKVDEVAEMVARDLGLSAGWLEEARCSVLLYVSEAKRVVGAVFAQRIARAYRVVPSEGGQGNHSGPTRCEAEASACACGVRAVWTHPSARRRGVATRLLDELRGALTAGAVAERAQLGFSQPTAEGAALARRYTGTDRFLTYAG